jgi:hypothetical protein
LELATGVRDGTLSPMSEVPNDCPRCLRQILEGCWKFHPEERLTFSQIGHLLDQDGQDQGVADYSDEDNDEKMGSGVPLYSRSPYSQNVL